MPWWSFPARSASPDMRRLLPLLCILQAACSPSGDQGADSSLAATTRALTEAGAYTACERTSATSYASLVASARCMTFTRPENPAEPEGRQLDLKVMVLPAIRPVPESDPVVILVGGPGQAARR